MKNLPQTFLAGVAGALTVGALIAAAGPLALRDDGIQFPDGSVQTTAAGGTRRVYLTNAGSQGSGAKTACTEAGFHMASMWEVSDPTRLEYAKELPSAFTGGDLGGGLPAGVAGWIRTGSRSSNSAVAGQGNCDLWTGTAGHGTALELSNRWDDVSFASIFPQPWILSLKFCSSSLDRVWCAED